MQCLTNSQISMGSRPEFKYSLFPFLNNYFNLEYSSSFWSYTQVSHVQICGKKTQTLFVISTLTKVLTHIDPENGKAQLAQVPSAMVALRRGMQISVENV